MKTTQSGLIVGVMLSAMALGAVAQVAPEATGKADKKVTAKFAALDLNQDGALSRAEFVKGAKKPKSAGKTFAKRDKDGDGRLTPEEFRWKPIRSALEKVKGKKPTEEEDEIDLPEPEESPLHRGEFGEKGVDY